MTATTDSEAVTAAKEANALLELEKAKSLLVIEKARSQLQLDRLAAEEALAFEKVAAAARAEQAKERTALLTEKKAQADAAAAEISATQAADKAATKAKFGSVEANTVALPEVSAGTNAGAAEASLLATVAIDAIATEIVTAIESTLVDGENGTIIAITGSAAAGRDNWDQFQLRKAGVQAAFDRAREESAKARDLEAPLDVARHQPAPAGAMVIGPAITGAGLLIDSFAKLGSYFRTDYKFEAVTVSGIDEGMMATAVIGKLAAAGHGVITPEAWRWPSSIADIEKLFVPTLQNRATSVAEIAGHEARAADLEARAAAPELDDAARRQLQSAVAGHRAAARAHQAMLATFADLMAWLANAEASAPDHLTGLLGQQRIADLGENDKVLEVRLQMAGGGSYTVKNLWTFLTCAMPFRVMGGAVGRFTLFSRDGKVLAAGVCRRHGGYHAVDEVPSMLRPAWGLSRR